MSCWKWFNEVLSEAGVTIADDNRDRIDKVIHDYIGEQSSYGRCSADWKKARKEIKADESMLKELVERVKKAA